MTVSKLIEVLTMKKGGLTPVEVLASIHGELAITEYIVGMFAANNPHNFKHTVVHIKTGLKIHDFKLLRDAEELVHRLNTAGIDWSFEEATQENTKQALEVTDKFRAELEDGNDDKTDY